MSPLNAPKVLKKNKTLSPKLIVRFLFYKAKIIFQGGWFTLIKTKAKRYFRHFPS